MLFDPKHEEHLGGLENQLRRAQTITPDLMFAVTAEACECFAAHNANTKAKFDRLIQSGAWVDATLALIELELPQWKLRRLVFEDGEWLCSLSKAPWLPVGFDETVEATHDVLPLAILIAFLEARRAQPLASVPASSTVPQVRPGQGIAICCDNFS